MVCSTAPAPPARAFAKDASQAAADPTVQVRVDVPEAMAEVPKPSLQRRVQRPDDRHQAVPVGAARLRSHRVLELGQALLARLPKATAKGIAQKVKAIGPR